MLKSALIIAALTLSAPAFAQSVIAIPQASPQTMAAAENGSGNRGERRGEGRGERNPAGKAVRQACMADIKSLCGDTQPGGGRIKECIRGKREQLSQGCKTAMMEARQQKQAARGQGGRGGEGQGNRERGQAGPKL
jgi:hypothetical protein